MRENYHFFFIFWFPGFIFNSRMPIPFSLSGAMEGFFRFLSDEFFSEKDLSMAKRKRRARNQRKNNEKKEENKQTKKNKTSSTPLKTDKTLLKLNGFGTCCGNGYSTLSAQ